MAAEGDGDRRGIKGIQKEYCFNHGQPAFHDAIADSCHQASGSYCMAKAPEMMMKRQDYGPMRLSTSDRANARSLNLTHSPYGVRGYIR